MLPEDRDLKLESTKNPLVRANAPLDIAGVVTLDCGLKKSFLECLCHAATVCLQSEGHEPGVSMEVFETESRYSLFWGSADDEMKRTWADRDHATENAAYCIALLLMHDRKGLISIERSARENGFDYWIGVKGAGSGLFQKRARLEVSGIRHGSESQVLKRLEEKMIRLKKYKEPLPAIVIVVEFGKPAVRIAEIHASGY